MNDDTEFFLDELIRRTDADYRQTVEGIIDVFRLRGELSAKQYSVLAINANKKGLAMPAELLAIKPPPQANDVFDVPRDNRMQIVVDLIEQVATAFNTAAVRLRIADR
jgi:hypothetical protein